MYVFGVPAKCYVCKAEDGYIVPSSDQYHCIGHPDSWSNCSMKTQKPTRVKMLIPPSLRDMPILYVLLN